MSTLFLVRSASSALQTNQIANTLGVPSGPREAELQAAANRLIYAMAAFRGENDRPSTLAPLARSPLPVQVL